MVKAERPHYDAPSTGETYGIYLSRAVDAACQMNGQLLHASQLVPQPSAWHFIQTTEVCRSFSIDLSSLGNAMHSKHHFPGPEVLKSGGYKTNRTHTYMDDASSTLCLCFPSGYLASPLPVSKIRLSCAKSNGASDTQNVNYSGTKRCMSGLAEPISSGGTGMRQARLPVLRW